MTVNIWKWLRTTSLIRFRHFGLSPFRAGLNFILVVFITRLDTNGTIVQILDDAAHISPTANANGKGIHPSYFPPAMDRMGSLALVRQPF